MTIMGSVDISFTNSTKIAKGAEQTATTAQETANGAAQTAGQAQATAETASQTAVQAAATAADAAQAAQIAITTANGKNKAYYGATTPTSPQSGDIWFVTDANGEVTAIRHWDGTQWVDDVDNVAVQEAIDEANQTAANAQQVGEQAQQTAEQATQVAQSAQAAADAATQAANNAQADADDAKAQVQSAVDTANQAAEDAQTAINQAQTAFDNAQDALSTANSAVDTANNASQTASNAATQSSNAWTKAQDAMAEAQKKADASSVYTKTEIDDALEGYATTTTVNTLTGRVDSAETAIQQNTNAIQLKADKSTVDTLTGRVSTAEATLTAQADQIAARITKTDADAKYATQTALTATANSLTSNISAVQTNLDNLQVGGRNLFLNSDFSNGYSNWKPNENATLSVLDSADYGHVLKVVTTGTSAASGVTQNVGSKITYGEEYTVSLLMKADEETTVKIQNSNTSWLSCDVTTEWKLFTVTIKPTNSNTIGFFNSSASTFYMAYVKIEKGNKATDWSPAPEDMVTAVQFNTLSQTLDSTVSRIGNAEGNISALQQTSDSFATRISNAEGNISSLTQTTNGLQTTVSGKVDKTTYNSFVTQTNTALQSKLSVQDAASTYATQSSLTQTANSLTSQITSVQTNLNNLQIGGRNLIKNSNFSNGLTNFRGWNPGTYTSTIREVVSDTTLPGFENVVHLSADAASQGWGFAQDAISVLPNTTYTYSFWYKFISTYGKVAIQISNGSAGFPTNFYTYADNLWHRATITITTGDNVNAVNVYAGVYGESKSGEVYITGEKLEIGNKATDWTPAPEDMATQSQITQLSDDINLRVQKGDVINQINVSTEGILIDGKKVHITGQTTIDNAVIKDAMIQSMTANKLTAGTIDANVITVKNINASNIVTGTLDASKATIANIDASKITTGTLNAARIAAGSIDASKLNVSSLSALSANLGSVTAGNISGVNINIGNGNFTVDTAGNLVAKNANITGIINATSGSFSGTLEGATGTFKGSISTPLLAVQADEITSYSEFGLKLQTAQWQPDENQPFVNNGFVVFNTLNSGLEIYHTDLNGNNGNLAGFEIEADTISLTGDTIVFGNFYLDGGNSIYNDFNRMNVIANGGVSLKDSLSGTYLVVGTSSTGNTTIYDSNDNQLFSVGGDGVIKSKATYDRTYSYSSNMYVTSNGYFGRVTSALKYKTDVEEVDLSNGYAERILQLKPKSWHDKAQLERYNSGEDIHLDRIYGLIAEDVEQVGLSEYVTYAYDENGIKETEGIQYDRLWTLLIPVVKDHKERLSIVEEQNNNLLLKIADLEARLAKLEE